nr:shikimate dehydrogenase [Deinobacterium chartae]
MYAHPAKHSLSPQMHTAAFQHAGLEGHYQALDVPPEQLGAALAALRRPGVLGANLSIPHKERALPHLDALSSEAQAIGAVNTVVNRGGQLHGLNTDAPGLLASLLEAGWSPQGTAVLLGAGGAARAAAYVLGQAGVRVWVINRTLERAERMLSELGVEGRAFAPRSQEVPWSEVGLLVNATSVGLEAPQDTPLEMAFPALRTGAYVCDMVYRPIKTRLLREAEQAGYNTVNGLGMLVHQARLAFLAWTGRDVPAHVFRAALELTFD